MIRQLLHVSNGARFNKNRPAPCQLFNFCNYGITIANGETVPQYQPEPVIPTKSLPSYSIAVLHTEQQFPDNSAISVNASVHGRVFAE